MHWHTFKQDNCSTVGEDGGCRVGEVRAGNIGVLPPFSTIRVLSYSNCQRSTHSITKWIFRNLVLFCMFETHSKLLTIPVSICHSTRYPWLEHYAVRNLANISIFLTVYGLVIKVWNKHLMYGFFLRSVKKSLALVTRANLISLTKPPHLKWFSLKCFHDVFFANNKAMIIFM